MATIILIHTAPVLTGNNKQMNGRKVRVFEDTQRKDIAQYIMNNKQGFQFMAESIDIPQYADGEWLIDFVDCIDLDGENITTRSQMDLLH